jgi:ADP-ribose pyrophosphatase YjhB (NUDIX family)
MTQDREFPSAPLPGVLALVVKDGKILLVKRAKDPDKDKWGLPGGLIEDGESPELAAMRELFEETAVVADAGWVIDRFEVRTENGRFHYALSVVALEWNQGTGTAGSDAADVGWFNYEEILRMPHSPNLPRLARLALPES